MSQFPILDVNGFTQQRRSPRRGERSRFVNPSAPALNRRRRNDQRLRDTGIDPDRLRDTLADREAAERRRESDIRRAIIARSRGDTAAEAAFLRRANESRLAPSEARANARESALLRGGEDRAGTIERIRTRQDIASRRREAEVDTQRLGPELTLAENTQRRLGERAETVAARTGLRETRLAGRVSERTGDTRLNTAIAEAENAAQRAQIDRTRLEQELRSAPNNVQLAQQLEEAQRREQIETANLNRARAQQESLVIQRTGPSLAQEAGAQAEVGALEAGVTRDIAQRRAQGIRESQPQRSLGEIGLSNEAITASVVQPASVIGEAISGRRRAGDDLVTELTAAEDNIRTTMLALRGSPDRQAEYARAVLDQIRSVSGDDLGTRTVSTDRSTQGIRNVLNRVFAPAAAPGLTRSPQLLRSQASIERIRRILEEAIGDDG